MTDTMNFDDADLLDPSLKNILEQETLQWVFVGGKGGVGKTTTSCCLGMQLAKARKKVRYIMLHCICNDMLWLNAGYQCLLLCGYGG